MVICKITIEKTFDNKDQAKAFVGQFVKSGNLVESVVDFFVKDGSGKVFVSCDDKVETTAANLDLKL